MKIKNYVLGLSTALLLGGNAQQAIAQAAKHAGARPAFDVGDNTLGFSLGFGSQFVSESTNRLPAFAVHFDHGLVGNVGPGTIGIGGIVGYQSAYRNYGSNHKQTWSDVVIAVRGTYHLTILKDKNNKFDPYGGLSTGIRISSNNGDYPGNQGGSYSDANPYVGFYVGAKYNFKPGMGVFSELGPDLSIFRIGFHLNFR